MSQNVISLFCNASTQLSSPSPPREGGIGKHSEPGTAAAAAGPKADRPAPVRSSRSPKAEYEIPEESSLYPSGTLIYLPWESPVCCSSAAGKGLVSLRPCQRGCLTLPRTYPLTCVLGPLPAGRDLALGPTAVRQVHPSLPAGPRASSAPSPPEEPSGAERSSRHLR